MVFRDSDGEFTTAVVYDVFWRPESARPAVDLLASLTRPDARLLDVGAGTGRFAIPLARMGHSVHCVEPSAGMRTALVAKASHDAQLRELITVDPRDASSFNADGEFDLAWCLEVLGYFRTDKELLGVFRNVRGHLSARGVFLFDGAGADEAVPDQADFELASEKQLGDDTFRMWTRTVRPDQAHCELNIRYERLSRSGAVLAQHEVQYWLRTRSRKHLEELLGEAGLRVREAFGDVDRRPFAEGARGLLLIGHA
ncbi:class I SAM-dependent methyltransferase [Saccharomonospora azurea]|uniref:class I SAM-dependent methyltransferase n=1 Tax=Saccharomonospora azurea TaxID=40988 RepID=UPI003D8E19B0